MFWFKKENLEKEKLPEKLPEDVIEKIYDRSAFLSAPEYKINPPIINTGVKFYPVSQKYEKRPYYFLSENMHIIRSYAEYGDPIEFFQKKSEALDWIIENTPTNTDGE